MLRDLAELQHEAIIRGYAHDFGCDYRLLTDLITNDPRLIGSISVDGGTDPGDDVTIYLIEGREEKGYLMLSDSFHVDPKKAAWIGALIART
jgi:hypothetical protein